MTPPAAAVPGEARAVLLRWALDAMEARMNPSYPPEHDEICTGRQCRYCARWTAACEAYRETASSSSRDDLALLAPSARGEEADYSLADAVRNIPIPQFGDPLLTEVYDQALAAASAHVRAASAAGSGGT